MPCRAHLASLRCLLVWAVLSAALPQARAQSVPAESPAPRVVQLRGQLEPYKIVEVQVKDLAAWGKVPGHTPWRLVPYIDGRALSGVYPVAVNLRNATLQFHLRITPDNRTTWTHLLSPLVFQRPVRFSVGLELQDPFETRFVLEDTPATLTVINPRWVALAAVVVTVFAVAFCALAARTTLLMERSDHASGPVVLRFSLAKVQLALWFFVVFGAFLVIWLVTGNFNTINSAVLATLGISAGTALGDAYLKGARAVSPGSSAMPPAPWAADRPAQPTRQRALRFVREMVSDSEGYSIYRFQMLAWTAALVVVFLADVYDDLVMPSFGPELLYLLGLSSGTYVAHGVSDNWRARPDPSGAQGASAAPVPGPSASSAGGASTSPAAPSASAPASPWGASS
jgi:hypothetical protein